ncbi:MAG: beta-galactosidase, partial [Clostridia bacterium]|nr:beta-galactosidase [Clostridia bacterium]
MLTFKDKKFYLDGEEFKLQSGAFHYFRALPEYWEDIMTKIKAAGLNTVETYTCWNMHEPRKGEYNFDGMLDIEKYIRTAQKVGLKVIMRTGPYICAEWENGGLPPWLLKKEYNIRLRCCTEPYLTHLKDWFRVLLGKIRPYLDENGGPVIALAVENEYGSFGDDFEYLKEIEKIYHEENMNCLYIAADGNKKYHLSTGRSGNHIVQGLDFGVNITEESLNIIDEYDKNSPYFTAEFWGGNFTNWGFDECTFIPDEIVKHDVNLFVDMGASFNMYMLFGGTNFGFSNGAQGNLTWMKKEYNPTVTSYDYDAPITEWCGYTQKYFDIKDAMERDHGISDT